MKWAEGIINFVYRAVYGIICIYFLNQLSILLGLGLQIGLNAWTAALTGVFGIPGVVLLFAIQIVSLL